MKPGKTKLSIFLAVILLAAAQSVALAGDVDVRGGSSTNTLDVLNTSTAQSNRVAVYGKSTPGPGYGIGGSFDGGYTGVLAQSLVTGTGDRHGVEAYAGGGITGDYGVYAAAVGGTSAWGVWARGFGGLYNYGVSGTAFGGNLSTINKGVEANASGTGVNYGVYAQASGGTDAYGIWAQASGGTSHNYAGYFSGDVITTGWYLTSDESCKDEIVDLDGSLDQIMELKPKSFRYRTEELPEMNLPSGYHAGLLAQDVEQVMPDLVAEFPVPEDPASKAPDGADNGGQPKTLLAVNYVELIPVLIGAIQEQQEQIATLQLEVARLNGR